MAKLGARLGAILLGVFLSLVVCLAWAAVPDTKLIEEQIKKLIPGATVDAIQQTPIDGMYEVRVGSSVVYATQSGDYMILGHLLDLTDAKPKSLTEDTLKAVRHQRIEQLDAKTMILFPAKKLPAEHVLTVFTDIDCGFCRKLHAEVPELNAAGVSVRYILFPRAGIGSESFEKAVNVWCAKDQLKAMTAAKAGDVIPAAAASCNGDAVVRKHLKLVNDLELNVTPVIVLEDGTKIPGYMPAADLIKLFG